jgi:BirA family transcriptional regulator, biotin operon repressor / biotin---[acetyl-CoA-carboxylase] ligase
MIWHTYDDTAQLVQNYASKTSHYHSPSLDSNLLIKSKYTPAESAHYLNPATNALWVKSCANTQDLLAQCQPCIKTLATLHQTQGRGRRGRIWHAPNQAVLCMSHRVTAVPWEHMRYIPLMIAVCLWEILIQHPYSEIAIDDPQALRIKWPNDLLFHQRKLAGILCETRSFATPDYTHSNNHTVMILGIGINLYPHINLPSEAIALHAKMPFPTHFSPHTHHTILVSQWIEALWKRFHKELDTFQVQQSDLLLNRWRTYALPVGTSMRQGDIIGDYQDIDISGALCLSNAEGIHKIDSGEVDVITSNKFIE